MIFLSYNWKDHSIIYDVETRLRELGVPVWIDYRELRPDSGILMQLDNAIRKCDVFVAVRQPSCAPSVWVRKELSIARAYEKKVVRLTAESLTAPAFDLKLQCLCSTLATMVSPYRDHRGMVSQSLRLGLTPLAGQLPLRRSSSGIGSILPVAGLRIV